MCMDVLLLFDVCIDSIGRRQCSGVNTSTSNGNYSAPIAPTDGDYVIGYHVDCDTVRSEFVFTRC